MELQPALEAVTSANLVPTRPKPSRTGLVFLVLALGALWFVCCRHLSAEWSFNEQYNYGWFVPFFAVYLFWLRWEDRPEPARISDFGFRISAAAVICSLLLLLPLRVFEIGSADWRPLGWVHVAAAVTITLSLIYLTGGTSWLRHFSFAVLFFFVAVPWITPIEGPIVQGLMRVVAATAAEALALFGIPAEVQGNLIRLPNGVVGVNEACSGVRSLQTSLMIGLLFGELKRLKIGPRLALIGSAVAIALVANFLRAFFLVWMASTHDLAAVGRWHDFAGYVIVGLVFVGTMWIASRWKTNRVEDANASREAARPRFSTGALTALFLWIVAVEAGAEFWYRVHERDLVARVPWSVRWPENERGYHELKIDNEVRSLLRFDSGREAAWTATGIGSRPYPSANYLFYFRWNPGSGTILRARAHRPDICLPAAGWRQVGAEKVENFQIGENRSLPFRRFDFVRQSDSQNSLRATAFFTLHEDVAHQTEDEEAAEAGLYSNWEWADRWRVVRNGIRNRGQQVLEIIILHPAESDQTEQQFAELLPKLIKTESRGGKVESRK